MPIAIYRKYRPKSFEELLGQNDIVEVLKNAAKKNKLAHAYLFYGPRGTGKTSAARLIAKIANCETREKNERFRQTGEVCNQCNRCSEIDAGKTLDVIEIDAASNRGIDEIRSLKESIKLTPSAYPFKVFIIDEVHMLTREAFNAFLKVMEEPPAHAIFILATTEFEKVPPTISSRAQKFHFKKLPITEIVKKLEKIAATERFKIGKDALELIASVSEGSFRDAESLLDQITSLEKEIDLKSVEKIIGEVGFNRTAKLAEFILNSDLKNALEYIAKINDEGYNVADLNKELIHYFRKALSLKFDAGLENLFKNSLTAAELEQLKTHSKKINAEKHIPLLKSLIRAYSEMRYSPFASIPLEIAVIENLKDGKD